MDPPGIIPGVPPVDVDGGPVPHVLALRPEVGSQPCDRFATSTAHTASMGSQHAVASKAEGRAERADEAVSPSWNG